jgi:hydroxymethylpyrimidine kinase/phosphomethylpyrimidine kinase
MSTMPIMKPYCLTIAGFDPSGGAGVLADLETFTNLKVEAQAVLTALTAQNSRRVSGVYPVPGKQVAVQAELLIQEHKPQAVKIGMLATAAVVSRVAKLLDGLSEVPVVIDPIIKASAGVNLIDAAGLKLLAKALLPRATVITPNIYESERLLKRKIKGKRDMVRAAKDLRQLGPRAVVITGGDRRGDPLDILYDGKNVVEFSARRIEAGRVRGTGCRYSAALAACLAKGYSINRAVNSAQKYIRKYIKAKAQSSILED